MKGRKLLREPGFTAAPVEGSHAAPRQLHLPALRAAWITGSDAELLISWLVRVRRG